MAKFRLRFNHYKCNAKLNGKRRRVFKQEKLIEPFFLLSHNRTHEDIKVQIIGHRDPKDQVAKKDDSWIFHLDNLHSKVSNQKRKLKY